MPFIREHGGEMRIGGQHRVEGQLGTLDEYLKTCTKGEHGSMGGGAARSRRCPRGIRHSNFRKRVWLPAISAAGLEKLRVHDLRHTAAALLVAEGAHPLAVKTHLGHSSIQVTMDVYGHLFPSEMEELASRLDARPCLTGISNLDLRCHGCHRRLGLTRLRSQWRRWARAFRTVRNQGREVCPCSDRSINHSTGTLLPPSISAPNGDALRSQGDVPHRDPLPLHTHPVSHPSWPLTAATTTGPIPKPSS